jgi:hypothetical protein
MKNLSGKPTTRDFGTTFEQFDKLRALVSLQLFTAVDVVTPTK